MRRFVGAPAEDSVRFRHQAFITTTVARAAKAQSLRYEGCPRKRTGSVSYYIWIALIEQLRRDGVHLERINPKIYARPKRLTPTELDVCISPFV
jgi:hypothetical protein